jgi:hypothetical protein
MTEKEEVCGVYLTPIGGTLTILIDYGHGPGVLTDDGRILCAGEGWITERVKPRRLGRYRMEVCPWHPSNI